MATASDSKTVLILGAGVGGLIAARQLRRLLPARHHIVVVEREVQHVFSPSLLWLAVGDRTADAIQRPVARLLPKGVEVIRGEVSQVDPAARTVTVGGQVVACDVLVIALGAELAPEMVPGLAESGHNFYTLAGAESLWRDLQGFAGGTVAVLTAAPLYKCPAAPYEAAMLIEAVLRKRKVRDRTRVEVWAAEPGPMGVAGPAVSAGVVEMLRAKDIAYAPGHQVVRVEPAARTLVFANGVTAPCDLLAYVPPHRAPAVLRQAGLCGPTGWLAADRHTLQTAWPDVYALGDVVSLPLQLGKPLPKAGVFAHRQAEVVARNIAAQLAGAPPTERFDGHGECFVEIGDGKAAYGSGNFYAEPLPAVTLREPGRAWHLAKVVFEKAWLAGKV